MGKGRELNKRIWSAHWGTETTFHDNLVFDDGVSEIKLKDENNMEQLNSIQL